MSNPYFMFRQFTIRQDRCAMKVSTDACIQGAWTPVAEGVNRILDIGTGTGLLALMLAQKNPTAEIDAIELDKGAAEQAAENIRASVWNDRVQVVHADATDYPFGHKYGLIISNPPFFNNSLLGMQNSRNMARHTLTLGYEQLFGIINNNLDAGGTASVLLPILNFPLWEEILTGNNWGVVSKLLVHPSVTQPPNRIVAICRPGKCLQTVEHTLFIRDAEGGYTAEFNSLMEPYYLDNFNTGLYRC